MVTADERTAWGLGGVAAAMNNVSSGWTITINLNPLSYRRHQIQMYSPFCDGFDIRLVMRGFCHSLGRAGGKLLAS